MKKLPLFLLFLLASLSATAEGLVTQHINKIPVLDNLGVELGGWVEGGATYNNNHPNSNSNAPVGFNDRHGEFQLNQLYGFIEKKVVNSGDDFVFGFRGDILFGTDARFTRNTNLDANILDDDFSRFYKLSFPQLYAEAYIPVGKGLNIKAGHFYTIIGYEVVTAPDNFFYSHAYTMQFGEPFEHTGVLLSTPLTDNVTLTAGGVLGWDNVSTDLDVWNFLGGINYISDDGNTNIALTGIVGPKDDRSDAGDRWLYSLVVTEHLTDRVHYTFQHDHGRESVMGNVYSRWYGINQQLSVDVRDNVSVGTRFEWFRDVDGMRVSGGDAKGNYFATTTGVNVAVTDYLKIRPEVRYDWFKGRGNAFGDENNQLTLGADIIVSF